ncbi:MAG: septum formation protein Maf [candidate division WOR-3 bacterium]|nr:MAG: septum formation protein Maf [candidate division WOR-3 bacterium]
MKKKFILASRSPRRLRLLRSIVPKDRIVVIESQIEEKSEPGEDAETFSKKVAARKAAAVWQNYAGDRSTIAAVIGADTVIWFENRIIGQPKDKVDAIRILMELRGKFHEVVTSVAVLKVSCQCMEVFCLRSKVWMHKSDEMTIKNYVATGEPMDKAGAYGIQERGRMLVAKYEGSYSNIVGLPTEELKRVLEDLL